MYYLFLDGQNGFSGMSIGFAIKLLFEIGSCLSILGMAFENEVDNILI